MNPITLPRALAALHLYSRRYVTAFALTLLPVGAVAATLPATIAPPAPFPLVIASNLEREPVAPGVARATYRLMTSNGPLVVSIVTVDLREPSVRIGTMLARDTVVSKDEPLSSMAHRSGAVAGINGDYFDINGSGAPVGLLVRNGALDRSPNARAALSVGRDRTLHIGAFRFGGSVSSGVVTVPLTGLNVWPPQGGVSLLTPAFGIPPANAANVSVLELAPFENAAAGSPRYRVASVTAAPPYPTAPVPRLAYGPAAQGFGPLPDVGDLVALNYDTDPPLASVAAAIGGGPELLRDGAPIDDPTSPNYADRDKRIPAAAAARLSDGTLAFVVVDGRRPVTSIGVNRAELIALLLGLGATDAMLFDSGGSATLVARVLGDADAAVINEPSDGVERPVADGIFLYSDAPVGPPARLVVRPTRIIALPGARVLLRARVIDAADHGLGDARGPWHIEGADGTTIDAGNVLRAGSARGARVLRVARDGVAGELPVEIVDRVARLVVGPARANPDPGGTLDLTLDAFDARARPVAIDGLVHWTAKGGTVDDRGRLVAGAADVAVTATAGGIRTTATIPVGRHAVPIALFDDRHRAAWKLVTVPANGAGAVVVNDGQLQLGYDFGSGGRAAYAIGDLALGDPVTLRCTIEGDGSGVALRATLADRFGDREQVTFARNVDFRAARALTARVPLSLAPPLVLHAFSVAGSLANPPITAAGTIGIHDCSEVLPGTAGVQTP